MTIPIAFPDIEIALADHLATGLAARSDTAVVGNEVPAQRPPRFVRVWRIGGNENDIVTDRPRVVAECYDLVGVNAAALARVVRALIKAVAPGYVGSIWVNKVLDYGVAKSQDPDTGSPRYVVTTELHVRGSPL